MKYPYENEKDIELFIETYGQTLNESERKQILKHCDLYTETYGKTIFHVTYNLDIAAKMKFKYSYWVQKNGFQIYFAPIVLFVILAILYNEYFLYLDSKIVLVIVVFLVVLFIISKRIVNKATQKVVDYQYYIRQVAKQELRKRGEKEGQ